MIYVSKHAFIKDQVNISIRKICVLYIVQADYVLQIGVVCSFIVTTMYAHTYATIQDQHATA